MLPSQCAVLLFSFITATTVLAYETAEQPNILLIVADDYGFHDIGYHNSDIKTPVLDKLASQGVKLENYYVQPICTPTRSQLLSGRYQIHTGLQHGIIWAAQPNGIPLNDTLLPQKLKQQGYATHAVGKWHVGFYNSDYTPTRRGFDTFFGYLTGSEDYYTHNRGGGYPGWNECKHWSGVDLHGNEQVVRSENGTYSTHLFTQEVIDIISRHDVRQPLFIYLPFQAVHGPLQVPDTYLEQYMHIQNHNRRIYAGMVSAMDEGVGNITQALKQKGIMNNTVIIFSTDNGGQIMAGGNNWPLRGWKGSLWEGGIRGVGFVHGDRLERRGSISSSMIHVSDWYPTIVHLAGGDVTGLNLDGYNQWDTISRGTSSPRTEILHNIDPGVTIFNRTTAPRAALRVGDMKLLVGNPGNGSWIPPPHVLCPGYCVDGSPPEAGTWLFNITADPDERNDLSSKFPEKVHELMLKLDEYNKTAVPVRYPPPDPRANPALHNNSWVPWED